MRKPVFAIPRPPSRVRCVRSLAAASGGRVRTGYLSVPMPMVTQESDSGSPLGVMPSMENR